MRATARGIFAAALLLIGGSPAGAVSCDWGAPEPVAAESSVPDGVSTASKDITIGQPFAAGVAAIDKEFLGLREKPQETSFDIDGKCQIRMPVRYTGSFSRAGRGETITALFGSPRRGSQLLAFERVIQYGAGEQLPLVSDLLEELKEQFGDPSAVTEDSSSSRSYYFVYLDRKKMLSPRDQRTQQIAWYACTAQVHHYKMNLSALVGEPTCEFVVHVTLDVRDKGIDPRIERYKGATIRFMDVKRARADGVAQRDWINKLKVEFARPEASPKRREFTPEPPRR